MIDSKSATKVSIGLMVALMVSLVLAEPLPYGENVCNITVPAKEDIIIEQPVKYEIKYQGMCGILPCTKTRIETRVDQTVKSLIKFRTMASCCQGYTETPDRLCAPICLKSCSNGGKCIAPNQCKCSPSRGASSPGFAGPSCERFVCLDENSWGSKCDKGCNCPMNAYCSANTGKCACYPGYRGANCSLECEPNSTHPECEEINELPPIVEPDANLVLEGAGWRQRSEALVLERTPDETLHHDNMSSFGANSLVVVLACFSLITLIGFFIFKRRYEKLRTEMIYGSGGSSSGASSTGSGPSDYSSSTYYANQRSVSNNGGQQQENMLSKNLSFAAATRQVLLGTNENGKGVQQQQQQQQQRQPNDTNRSKLIVNPLVESNLIRSLKQAEQNLYTDAVKVNFFDRPLPNPDQSSINITTQSADHIYQVPRSRAGDESLGTTGGATINDNSSEEHIYKTIESNDGGGDIYEEIKPRSSPKN